MPVPLNVSRFSKIQIGFTFPVPARPGSPGQRAVKPVCVCVLRTGIYWQRIAGNEREWSGRSAKRAVVSCMDDVMACFVQQSVSHRPHSAAPVITCSPTVIPARRIHLARISPPPRARSRRNRRRRRRRVYID